MSEEVLGWLLPDARADEQVAVRRVITALRLLREDARGRAGRRAAPSWQRARKELESLERSRRRHAIDGLLHAHLLALRSADSFLDLGPRTLEYREAWRTLLLTAGPAEAGFTPAPAETPLAVVERLLAAGESNGASPEWHAWWSACARHVTASPTEAERNWEALLRAALETRACPPFRARLLAGLVAARLDRFQPARAWELHEEHLDLALADPGLRRFFGWSALLCGHESAARRLLHGLPPGLLPAPLLELRADRPAWAALLPGASPAPAAPVSTGVRGLERSAFGALLAVVFARRGERATEILALDAPSGLRAEVERRCQAGWVPGGLLEGESLRRLRRTDQQEALPDSLAGPSTAALILAPIRSRAGELAGWIQIESSHQLLPSTATVSALARAWNGAILAARADATARVRVETGLCLRSEPFTDDDPRSEFTRRLFSELGPSPGRRAYWIELGRAGARVRAERGASLADWTAQPGGAAILARLRAKPGSVHHRGEPSEALHSAAAAGCALPLRDSHGACVLGVLVLESVRAEVLSERVLAAARAALTTLEPVWWAASFRAACRAHDQRDLAWDLSARFLSTLAPAHLAAAGSCAPLLIVGPPGAGRRTLARWLHFRRSRPDADGLLGASAGAACPRVLELADLALEAQLELARSAEDGERFFLVAMSPAHVLRERGSLSPGLARVLDPSSLFVPPLRERRDEIPALVRVLADNLARAESLRPTRFEDGAVADLWRQDWRGNASELGALVARLVRAFPGRELGAPEVRAAMRSLGLEFHARLPSRRPCALDLELALVSTRHRIGSENLARAARYLGWDADTLRARLDEPRAGGGPS